jgi:transposase-like protein
MSTVTKPYPKEFRDDVVNVARNREPGVELSQIAKDFGIHFTTLYSWLKKAEVEEGERPGATAAQSAELREAKKRIKTLEQEVEVLRRAAAYFSQAHLPGK